MPNTTEFMPSIKEAAYIAGISVNMANRLIDEEIVPSVLYENSRGRRVYLLTCALGAFYFKQDKMLTSDARKRVIKYVVKQAQKSDLRAETFSLRSLIKKEWVIPLVDGVTVNLWGLVKEVKERSGLLSRLEKLVDSDPEILGGTPVFKGTRVPVRTIADLVKDGASVEEIKEAYPAINDEMLSLAPVYTLTHPQRGRPRSLADAHPTWKKTLVRTVKR